MANEISSVQCMASDSSFVSSDSTRRRSTFYVPLNNEEGGGPMADICSTLAQMSSNQLQAEPQAYNPDLSACSFDWSLDDSLNNSSLLVSNDGLIGHRSPKSRRYGVVLTSVHIDDTPKDNDNPGEINNTSTPKKPLSKTDSRSSIVDRSFQTTPIKEKSATLPQNMNLSASNTFPPKNSFLLKSSPRISFKYFSDSSTTTSANAAVVSVAASPSPKKSLSFIRRAHSTKLSRSNSLLKSLTSKCVDQSVESLCRIVVSELQLERLESFFRADNCTDLIKDLFFKECVEPAGSPDGTYRATAAAQSERCVATAAGDDSDVHSDTSYEKACRRGSAPNTPILGQKNHETPSTSRFTNFFSKRSNPLKRTKSVTKLERSKRGPGGLRGSRSHESLLSSHAVMSTIDLSCTGAVGVAPVHQSVLGRRHCFQVRGGPRGERYYSCSSRQERDLWIYSLRKSIAPNAEHTRHTDNSLKMWIYEAKNVPSKKRYFCEINLDKTLYGRTSVKLRTDLLFWGEYFDFPDIPDINVITVNVFREGDKKKKRDKHTLVGSVKIPIHDVTTRAFSEDWYQIISEKHDSIGKNSTKEPIPTLRIKCRFQSTDILPIEVYSEFQQYLKDHYRKICECLEPDIGVKAKEDIGQALVLFMYAQGMAGAFLTDVVALDLIRVDDQRLTFRGNSLATKSMEAFLKLTGEQYLQDTLTESISDVIASERDCEVDPLKATGSLSRQQQSLRDAVRNAWNSIADSHAQFPHQLRDCFATFRERLQILNREDMADNLISASIFLRFLCPAILTPSLFNITNELPTDRATRNLTLMAKTLQTLANFTRFQGKEDFMEFLNDFLEQEAPRMKEFLHRISTRLDTPASETILDWSGYIDQGKQLSILHSLLSESFQKLPQGRHDQLNDLKVILDKITKAKETSSFNNQSQTSSQLSQSLEAPPTQENQHPQQLQPGYRQNQRGVIRGVLTPSSLERNIFRYNDPTVSPLLNLQQNSNNQSQTSINGSIYSNHQPLQHSQSTSSISSVSNHNNNTTNSLSVYPLPQQQTNDNHFIPTTVDQYQSQTTKKQPDAPARNYNTTSHFYSSASSPKSPAVRSNTLPRKNPLKSTNQVSNIEVYHSVSIEEATDTINANLIQIGLDPSSAFVRKSPTPIFKIGQQPLNQRVRTQNGSNLSLHSDRTINSSKNALNLNLNLGIPHYDLHSHNPHSNMPMNLEDLDDLLKYGEEHADDNQSKHPAKEQLTSKGSNASIGVCSSGYQTTTQSPQSSSPVELTVPQTAASKLSGMEYSQHPIAGGGRRPMPQMQQISSTPINAKFTYLNNNNHSSSGQSALAFKNPLYKMHNTPASSHLSENSCSLTPSSSEERLSMDNYCTQVTVGNGTHSAAGKGSEAEYSLHSLNGTAARRQVSLGGSNRVPRTNPLMQYKREDPITTEVFKSTLRDLNSHHHSRYQRRSSMESARTLSDSSTDTEGMIQTDGKRRRTPRSVEQCEREIQRLQTSLDGLRSQIGEVELLRGDSPEDSNLIGRPLSNGDTKMRSIISRLITMEEDLRREQLKMSLALSHKQRVIEAQGQQIAALDAANNRLLSALSSLRQRYESQPNSSISSSSHHQNAAAGHGTGGSTHC